METFDRQILVDNFKECVRQCQQCILWAIGTSFSALLIVAQMRTIGSAGIMQGQFHVDLLFSHLSLPTAWALASAIYVILGSYAAYTANQAERNVVRLAEAKPGGGNQTMTDLVLYPSLVTSQNAFLRLGGIFSAVFMMILSWVLELLREEGNQGWKDKAGAFWVGMVAIALILLTPYLLLFTKLWRPIGVVAVSGKKAITAAK